jgi:hypothetical protein
VLCFNRRKGVLVIGSKVVESTLSNVVFDEGLEHVRILGCRNSITLGGFKAVVLCSLYAVDALNLGEIARRLLRLLKKRIGRRRIHTGSGATGSFRMGARGGAGTGGSPVRESICESARGVTDVEGIREGLAVTEGVFGGHSLAWT